MQRILNQLGLLFVFSLFFTACTAPQVTQGQIAVRVTSDGNTAQLEVPAGSTVEQALTLAGVSLNDLDRVEPPTYTLLSEGGEIHVVRVTEDFSIEEVILPFEKQVVKNESLPDGETRLIQPGVNGLQEITYRRVIEDGLEISLSVVKTVNVKEPVAEIVMVGSQTPYIPVSISGRLAFLAGGNAWVMEGTTGNRRPVITTGDLDGQIFRLSPGGDWLLFTRRSEEEGTINTLWAAKIEGPDEIEIDLQVENIIHFADWVPTSVLRVAYSTVEPRDAPPGWQANNDLQLLSFSTSGWVSRPAVALESNSGGIYGWWGMSFALAPDGLRLGYARPDGVGVLDLREDTDTFLVPIFDITPLQTQSDWAWVPGLNWSPTGNILYTVNHAASQGIESPEESPLFDLTALPLEGGAPINLTPQSGMFTYPVPSPIVVHDSGELSYQLAYLQSIFPTQSKTSRYRLVIMDRDGSNRQVLFPEEGSPGLDPQEVLWAPEPVAGVDGYWIAFLHQGNLWVVNSITGETQQLSGDGLINRLDWR